MFVTLLMITSESKQLPPICTDCSLYKQLDISCSGLDSLRLNSAQGYFRVGQGQRQKTVVGCLVFDVTKERSASVIKGKGNGEIDIREELNPYKQCCGNPSMLARTALSEATGQLKLQQAYQHYCSTSISEHIDTFIQISYIAQ